MLEGDYTNIVLLSEPQFPHKEKGEVMVGALNAV